MGHGASKKYNNKSKEIRAQQLPCLKIVIVGDCGVGKTSLLVRYVHNQFTPLYLPTKKVAIENVVKKINIPNHALVSLTFWDIPGKDDFNLYKSYFTNLDAAIVVVDMSQSESLQMALVWKQMLLNNMTVTTVLDDSPGVKTPTDIYKREESTDKYSLPILLIGTKLDLVQDIEIVSNNEQEINIKYAQMIENYGTKYNFTGSVVVSSKQGDDSVHEAFQSFIRHILEKKYLPRQQITTNTDNLVIDTHVNHKENIFDVCGISSMDSELEKSEKCIKRIQSIIKYSEDSLQKFYKRCIKAGLIEEYELSLGNCIVALKKYFCSPDTKLDLKEERRFCTIIIKSEKENFKMAVCYDKVFKCFNYEYSATMKSILCEFPDFYTTLKSIDNRIGNLCENYNNERNIDTEPNFDYKITSEKIEENRATLRFYQNKCLDKIKEGEQTLKKIKTAFLW